MKRAILAVVLAVAPSAVLAQTVPVQSTQTMDGPSHLNGKTVWVPVLSNGTPTYFHEPGGGLATVSPVWAAVTDGAWILPSMPDSAYTIPANLCWRVTFYGQSGSPVATIPCVQPSAGNYWYSAGVDNFDNWLPSIPPLPTIAYVQSVNGCTGVCTVSSGSVGDSDVLGQTASQATVNLVGTVPSAGKYRIGYTADQNALCPTGSESVFFTFTWTSANHVRTVNSITLTLGSAQSSTSGAIEGVVPIFAAASSAITYTSTVTGSCATGGPASYDAHISVEAVQ